MRLLSNLHVKDKSAVLPDRAIRRQTHYFIYRPRTTMHVSMNIKFKYFLFSVLILTDVVGLISDSNCKVTFRRVS